MTGLGKVGGQGGIGLVQGGALAGESAAVRPAPAQGHRSLAAASMHRSEALQAFKQSLMNFNRDGVSRWVGSAYRHDSATAAKAQEALDRALSSGLDAADRLQGQRVTTAKFADIQSQGLERSTRALLVLSTAYDRFEAGRAIFNDPKASLAQQWEGVKQLVAAHQDLRAQARQADLGSFGPDVQHNLKLLMKGLAAQCDSAVQVLEGKVREQSSQEVRKLFAQRDALGPSILAANDRLDAAIKSQSPKDQETAGAEIRGLMQQRAQMNERIGKALNSNPAGGQPMRSAHPSAEAMQAPMSVQPQPQPQPQAKQPPVPSSPEQAPQSTQAPQPAQVQAQQSSQAQVAQQVAASRPPAKATAPTTAQALQEGAAALDRHIEAARAKVQVARQGGAAPALKAAEAALELLVKAQSNLKTQAQREESLTGAGRAGAQPARTGGFFAKISRHFQQNSVTDSARRGWGDVNFPRGLEARYAVAAHLKGVLERAGIPPAEIPRRRDLRAQMQEPQAPKTPPPMAAAVVDPDWADMERRLAILKGDLPGPAPSAASAPASPPAPSSSAQADMDGIERRLAALLADPQKTGTQHLDELSAQIKPVVDESKAYLRRREAENDAVLAKVKAQADVADRRNALFTSLMDINSPENAALLRELDELEGKS